MNDLPGSPSVVLQEARALLAQCILDGGIAPDLLLQPESMQLRYLLVCLKHGIVEALDRGADDDTLALGLAGIEQLEVAIREVA